MSIKLRRQASGSFPNPAVHHLAFFVDENGIPSLKDSNGVVTPAVSLDGSPISLDIQGSAPAAESNTIKLYAKDVGGVSQPFFRSDDGTEVQIKASSGGAFWDTINGKAEIEVVDIAGSGSTSQTTGITVSLPASTWVMLPFRVEFSGVTADHEIVSTLAPGHLLFDASAGTAEDRLDAIVFDFVASGATIEFTGLSFTGDEMFVDLTNNTSQGTNKTALVATVGPYISIPFTPTPLP